MNWTSSRAICESIGRSGFRRCVRRFTVSFRKRFAASRWPTLCAETNREDRHSGRRRSDGHLRADGKDFAQGNFFLQAKPIGGLRMIDGQQADDKIIAVLEADLAYGHIKDISECPKALVDRLKHYFLSYKQLPGERRGALRSRMSMIERRRWT